MNLKEQKLYRKGFPSFFTYIYNKNYEVLVKYAYQLLRDKEAADEIVDDIILFLNILTKILRKTIQFAL